MKGSPASLEAIFDLENKSGLVLSESFKNFALKHDGARPEVNTFRINEKNECGVNRFIPISQILSESKYIENLPDGVYPVAWAEGGNYVLLNQVADGQVLFWDHEIPEDMVKIAESFDLFIASLQPFDPQSIELKPGQAKSAWIDPEFLKRLNSGKLD